MPEQQMFAVQAGKAEDVQLALLKGLLPGVYLRGGMLRCDNGRGMVTLEPVGSGRWAVVCSWRDDDGQVTVEDCGALSPLDAVTVARGFLDEFEPPALECGACGSSHTHADLAKTTGDRSAAPTAQA